MELSRSECQKARMSRDARFDGVFFVAVKTTGIFCRPVCPANLPKEENVEYYPSSAQALQAGFRPCLRCRPDAAPGSWAWKGTETSFQRAVALIEQGALQTQSLVQLSERLGLSDRYLRKLFNQYLGMSPKQYALYHQLMFAKQLLHNSRLAISDIAFASGFNSVRRFNDAFSGHLKLTPGQVRKSAKADGSNRLTLLYRGELDWDYLLDFYRTRLLEGVESIEGQTYLRTVDLEGVSGWFALTPVRPGVLEMAFELSDVSALRRLVVRVRRMFDLDVDLAGVESQLRELDPNLIRRSGIRIPGVWSAWEAGVRAILGQQVSVKAAIGQLNLLRTLCIGENGPGGFPNPQQVLKADLSQLKMPQSRKETLHRFALAISENPELEPEQWLTLKGIGPWTINYARLRGISEPDCFLDQDLVVKKALPQYPNVNKQSVAPWGSYATLHCWNNGTIK